MLGLAVVRALTWERRDRRDLRWYPQGISTSVRTDVTRDVLVTSWYSKKDEGSFIDLEAKRYRHVLLVEPTVVDGVPGFKPLKAHAGGVVWHGPYLHVAATGRGFLTCRVEDAMKVPTSSLGAGLATYGHDYVLPVRFAYRAANEEGVSRLRFSFMTLDRSTDPPSLVVGEYGNSKQTRRFARFPTDAETGLLSTGEDGVSHRPRRRGPAHPDAGNVRGGRHLLRHLVARHVLRQHARRPPRRLPHEEVGNPTRAQGPRPLARGPTCSGPSASTPAGGGSSR